MSSGRFSRSLTGLAAGALLGAALLGVFALGSLAGLTNAAYSLFEWLTRVLPGRVVIFGLETTLRTLEALGLNIKDTSKVTEEAIALAELFVASAVIGLLFFLLTKPEDAERARNRGLVLGGAAGVLMLAAVLRVGGTASLSTVLLDAIWVLAVFVAWGWALGRLFQATCAPAVARPPAREGRVEPAPPHPFAPPRPLGPPEDADPEAEITPQARPPAPAPATASAEAGAERLDRRHFIIRMGGLVATFVVLGAEVADILAVEGGPAVAPVTKAPIPFPNAGSPVKPVPGTRPEYTPVAEHYRVDIDLTPPSIDAASWRLRISGLVARPLQLTVGQLRGDYAKRDQFITLECISNPIGGPLIGTTLWSGPSLRDVLATAQPRPGANYAHMLSQDGFDEVVALTTVQADQRVILAYDWNGQPLPTSHGFPLRVYIPDLYGMKQPKWITDIVLVPDFIPGYWVRRGWDKQAIRRTTSVIDTVATSDLQKRAGRTYVPVGGIADAGARGISKVEIQVDGGPWEPAELRQPLSQLTWVIWRYEWPWNEGEHVFGVRAYDGQGVLQTTTTNPTHPSGATGIDTMPASILPR
ncbi:MAG TPA: molybdopterin-dependent oxidoreductase [Thermoleophilia bacterium]